MNQTFLEDLRNTLKPYSILNHPFYQTWTQGKLTQEELQHYSQEYFPHVHAFPQYISSLHSICPSQTGRQMLLANLNEEEKGLENHPELWKRFSEALGVSRDSLSEKPCSQGSNELVAKFRQMSREDYATGLGAIYAYEAQVPEVAEVKIEGLKKFYGITEARGLAFFEVHREADVHHRQEFEAEMNLLSEEEKERALEGAKKGAKAVWDFLSTLPVSAASACPSQEQHA